uniref:Cytochrome c oxidase subunit 2 n=1 Tax=Triraphis sp. QL-2013 TaxID=1421602 RepID=A0A0A6ZL15_9HYME|nr:cytochrome c oxidase subunit II [Triraphis sp. QL-2013]
MNNWLMMNFQDYNSYIMMLMIEFHDLSLLILLMIILFIFYIIIWFMFNCFLNKNILHNHMVEFIWTMIPMFILLFMAIPSLKILYMIEDVVNPFMTLKIMGHQWYWSYEYIDFNKVEFDSFMVLDYNIKNLFRLLDVDNRLILPFMLNIRGLVSSFDVIHSWTISSLGIKIDAIPGRINQINIFMDRLGLNFGQCSEICGLNHSFMPIVLESVDVEMFLLWLMNV